MGITWPAIHVKGKLEMGLQTSGGDLPGPTLSNRAKGPKLLVRYGLVGLEEELPGKIVAAKQGSGASDSQHHVPSGSSHLTHPRQEPPSSPPPRALPGPTCRT